MNQNILDILEIALFFITFPFVFQAFNAIDTSRFFKKGFVWQIQILYIFGSVIFTYLFVKAIINIISLTGSIFL